MTKTDVYYIQLLSLQQIYFTIAMDSLHKIYSTYLNNTLLQTH